MNLSSKVPDHSKDRPFGMALLGAGAIAACLFLHGCSSKETIPTSVLLISIDTCRADFLSCYGYPRRTTPNIDSVASQNLLFENVVTPVPLTLPAHGSMLTGTNPPYHGIHDNAGYRLCQSSLTLAELIHQKGFATAAVIGSKVLHSQFGLNQGFDFFDERFEEDERSGEAVSRAACDWLAENKKTPFFLFLHYYDPHHPYTPPQPFASKFRKNLYAGEIAYVDRCIAQVLDEMKNLGLYDSALVVITSDHGEMLDEHGESTHGYFIYQSAIRVPLIVKLPGQSKPKRIKELAGVIDIAPTILGILGIPAPGEMKGKDLLSPLGRDDFSTPSRYYYAESMEPTKYNCNLLLGVVTDGWKFIHTTKPELYDLVQDPNELGNLANEQPQRAKFLRDQLKQILEEQLRTRQGEAQLTPDQETLSRLKSLGYVTEGTIDESFTIDPHKNDPKDCVDFHRKRVLAAGHILEKKYKKAKKICAQMLSKHPDVSLTYVFLGDIALDENELDKAVSYYSRGLEVDAKNHYLHRNLGLALSRKGQNDAAIEHLQEALRLKPDYNDAHFELALVFSKEGNLEKAMDHLRAACKLNPNWPEALNHLAWIQATRPDVRSSNAGEAVELALRACEISGNKNPFHLDTLAAAYAAAGRFAEAVQTAEKARDVLLSLGEREKAEEVQNRIVLYKSGRPYRE